MQISFYVLADHYAAATTSWQTTEVKVASILETDELQPARSTDTNSPVGDLETALNRGVSNQETLKVVCRLVQTVLKKSPHSLVVIDNHIPNLHLLNDYLWHFEPTSFIAHDLVLISDDMNTDKKATRTQAEGLSVVLNTGESIAQIINGNAPNLVAPVTLMNYMPNNFDGVVLNLSDAVLPLIDSQILPDRLLEIIAADAMSKQQGRLKYRYYQDKGFELQYFPIN